MKRFILKVFKFIFPIFLITLFMEVLLRQSPNDYKFKKEYLDSHSNEIETLVLGSSHSFYGIDPIYFSNKTFNASHISQSLDIDFEILKKYEANWENLNTEILPIYYFTLFENLNNISEAWRLKNYLIYYNINVSDSWIHNLEMLSNQFKINIERLNSYYIKGDLNLSCSNLGWGTDYKSDNAKELNKSGKTAAIRHTKDNFNYLDDNIITVMKIIEFCNNRDINIILFTPPSFITYYENLDAKQLKITVETSEKVVQEFGNCYYINLLNNSKFNSNDFYDADHLNEIGAKKLSLIINEKIKIVNKDQP